MPNIIDLNRGVEIHRHRASGMYVYMYIDTPGVYLNHFGKPVDEALAEQAGYEVVRLGKEKLKRERMASAMSAIERELALADSAVAEVILEERGGYKVVQLALGNANIFDDEGNKLNSKPIPEQEARLLLTHMVPVDAKPTTKPIGKETA